MAKTVQLPIEKDRISKRLEDELTRQLHELKETLTDAEAYQEAEAMVMTLLNDRTANLLRGGNCQTIPGYFFPLSKFKTRNPKDMAILKKWRKHYEEKGIKTKLSFWGGKATSHPDRRRYVDLAVNWKQHLEALGNNGYEEE